MNRARRIKGAVLNAITFVSSGISVFVLIAVFVFVFSRGWRTLNWHVLTGNYATNNILVTFETQEQSTPAPSVVDVKEPEAKQLFTPPSAGLEAGSVFSSKFGFAVKDAVSHEKQKQILLTYVDPESPLQTARNATAGPNLNQPQAIEIGTDFQKIEYRDSDGKKRSTGLILSHDAQKMIDILDTRAASLQTLYFQTLGGGIRGSLVTTLMLIGLTLVIALPVGISAAIYLNELARRSRLTAMIRSSIEMLSGVPSIVFGLMGMTMLFPITAFFGITTQSILLGAMTMAVVLLPVIIRQTEEALLVVPTGLRMASLSLGATSTQTIMRVVLPNALPGILSATLLSVSRIIGESAALIYTMGVAIEDNPAINRSATTLAVQIWRVMSGEQPNFELASAISIVVLMMVLILNLTVKIITSRLNRRWST